MKIFTIFVNLLGKIKPNEYIPKNKFDDYHFYEAIKLIKTERAKLGISRYELSSTTRISIVVIEAIEEGIVSRLPERAFLKQMLLKIEKVLHLPPDSLSPILLKAHTPKPKNDIKTFTPLNINIFRLWYGNAIYIILMLICIFILNKQQYKLSIINSHTVSPLNPNLNPIEQQTNINKAN